MIRRDRREAWQLGRAAEAFVAAYLRDEGFVVEAQNLQLAGAELDLVVRRDRVVRFVEVKARQSGDGSALESIGPRKQARLRRAAEAWLAERPWVEEAAFLVAIVEERTPGELAVTWIDDAF